jgi:hypothetical protein
VLALSFSLNLYRSSYDPSFAFFSLRTRAWELLVGALVGYCAHKNLVFNKVIGQILGWLGVSVLAIGILLIDRHLAYPSGWALLPVFGTGFLLLAGQSSWINSRVLSTKTLVAIGLISYPLYLWHWLLLSMTAVVDGHMSAMQRSLLVLCSFGLATMTYWLMEKPIRQKHNTGKTALTLSALMTALALCGLFVYKSNGALGQFSVPALVMESGQQDCMRAFKAKEFCVFGNPNAEHSILVYGDSHAEHLTAALNSTFGKTHRIIFSYASSCFFGYRENFHQNAPGCQPFIDLIGTLKGTKLDAVIRSQLWHGYGALADDAAFDRAIRDAATAFDLGPTKIIIVGSIPNADLACEKRNYYFAQRDGQRQCSDMLEGRAQSERFITRTSALSLASNVYFVYPQQKLCDQNTCKVIENGVSYYTDINHLSKAGAMLVMPEIASLIKK